MELTEGRMLLREFTEEDVSGLLAIHSDPRVLRYYPPELGTQEHARMLVGMFIRWANEYPRDNFQFAIVDRPANALLGSCGIRTKGCPQGQAEFGIGIDANCWGKGIAREAARIILRFGFAELDLHEVRSVTVSQNEGVTKFVRRLGFRPGIPYRGEPWMAAREWTALDWVMTRETWMRQTG